MGLVVKGYFRSWDSSQSRLWTPANPAQLSLSVGSASTTVAAAMFVTPASFSRLRPAHNEPQSQAAFQTPRFDAPRSLVGAPYNYFTFAAIEETQ